MRGVYFRSPERIAEITRQIRNAVRPKKHSEETKEKIRQSKIGKKRVFTPEWIENLRKASIKAGCKPPSPLGRKLTQEQKDILSKLKKGNKYWLGRKHSEETKKKIGDNQRGEKSWNWKGGITPSNVQIRNSIRYQQWRKDVFSRDNYTCVECGIKNHAGLGKRVVLNADHIKPFSLYPELRFELSNGRTLCFDCHKKTDTYGGKKVDTNYQIKNILA